MNIFSRKENGTFFLEKAISLIASDALRGCQEAEMSQEAAARIGRQPTTNSLFIRGETLAHILNRDMTVAGVSGSQYLVATETMTMADVLRPFSILAKAGATVLSDLTGNVVLPNASATTAAEWLPSENDPVTADQPTIGQLSLSPKNIVALIKYTSSLVKSSVPGLDAMLARDLLRSVAAAHDSAALIGTGADGQPLGISGTPNVVTASGAALTYAALLGVIEDVCDGNADQDALAIVGAPGVRTTLAQRVRVSGGEIPIWHDRAVVGHPAYVTTGAAAGDLFVGDFRNVVMGIWGDTIEIMADPYSDFATGKISLRAWLTADVGVTGPTAFAYVDSVS